MPGKGTQYTSWYGQTLAGSAAKVKLVLMAVAMGTMSEWPYVCSVVHARCRGSLGIGWYV